MPRRLILAGAAVCLPREVATGLEVVVEGGLIADVRPAGTGSAQGERLDLTGLTLVPGLIDGHIHGGLAHDVMDASVEGLGAIAGHLATHGVTGWLATTLACPAEQLDAVLTAVASAMAAPPAGATLLGAHLESNFLAAKYKGAQPEAALASPDDEALRAVLDKHRAVIRVVTLAPELPGALALIAWLRARGIAVSVGHSDATYAQVEAAVAAGATRVTHLCNAQRGFHHREPGVLGAGLAIDALATEVIADLEHVHPAGLRIAYRCKGPRKLMLVSDALRGAGMPAGQYELGGRATTLDGRVARLADGTIAGSVITLERAIANLVSRAGVPLADAVAMASLAPALDLGLADRGAIAPGLRADLALLDDAWECRGAMIGGNWAFGPTPRSHVM